MSTKFDIALRNDISEVTRVLDALETFSKENDIPSKKAFQLQLVLDELITNIISYGSAGRTNSDIRLSIEIEKGVLIGDLTDNGLPFNPLESELPEFSADIQERQVGGVGLKLVRTYVDELEYRHEGGFNRLRLKMRLDENR